MLYYCRVWISYGVREGMKGLGFCFVSVGNHVFTGGSAVQPQLSVMPMRALQAEYR